jgi:lipopolysaccharide transport system ATP-binding protein
LFNPFIQGKWLRMTSNQVKSDIAVQAVNISKQYRIGDRQVRQTTLRDLIAANFRDAMRLPARYLRSAATRAEKKAESSIWALDNLTFDIKRGDVVGLIGHNGAGKSTLLRILSFVTEPTRGHVHVRGRVGSLLEIGTGFHSELTGRENIFLSGAILGMKKAEIVRKFDEIVAFANVDRFIDTQIKHYSSGMYMRLGFAVAAHLDPEILLVDEVLAVGDADFQQKCIRSMQEVANSGRTVIVVSHNMAIVESLCRTAVWIDRGQIRSMGKADNVISEYLTHAQAVATRTLLDHPRHTTDATARFISIKIANDEGEENRKFKAGSNISINLEIQANQTIKKPTIGIEIRTPYNQLISHIATREAGYELPPLNGLCKLSCEIRKPNLLPGRYYINLILSDMSRRVYDEVHVATFFDITSADVFGTGLPIGKEYGLMFLHSKWEIGSGYEP